MSYINTDYLQRKAARLSGRRNRRVSKTASRRGFTLVELLVSVALVVLLMLMYATVFEQATGAITLQQAIGKNDERSRMLVTVIKDDLNRRTFKNVIPFLPGPTQNITDWGDREGYFSFSENDPTNNTDDVLSFTVRIKPDQKEAFYLGKATFLDYAVFSNPVQPPYFIDQPEGDDGQLPLGIDSDNDGILDQIVSKNLNQMGASSAAEISYFLRNGTLYRRIQLIREPFSSTTLDPPMIDGNFIGANLIGIQLDPNDATRDAYLKDGSFWSHFDYSAHFNRFIAPQEIRFSGTGNATINYLDNQAPTTFTNLAPPLELPYSLGNPYLRFGNSLSKMDELTPNGSNSDPKPLEYVTSPGPDGTSGNADDENVFIGRFTMQETSHSQFGYPGFIPAAGDPHFRTFTYPALTNGVVSAYSSEKIDRRRGEDILLTNVHSFDIKVWDEGLAIPGWVNLGHGGGGHYGSKTTITDLALTQKFDNRYDTWTPFRSPGPDGILGNNDDPNHIGLPSYRPFYDFDNDGNADDLNGDGIIDTGNGGAEVIRLKSIQITIRFLDEASGKMRQLTLQHTLD